MNLVFWLECWNLYILDGAHDTPAGADLKVQEFFEFAYRNRLVENSTEETDVDLVKMVAQTVWKLLFWTFFSLDS